MVDPSTSRTLRIYPLFTLTKWEVLDSTVIVICAKTLVYIEAKLTRMKSNSYTSNALLDTVTVAIVQLHERLALLVHQLFVGLRSWWRLSRGLGGLEDSIVLLRPGVLRLSCQPGTQRLASSVAK
uniref:Uncharacterized protein n=1 Tax=Triticum urartu TaxID=4572 RepID=A0A8R7R4W7_TRIUA